ncbi:hypothetical protein ACIA5D_00175 [Actinoplanes sp. NPDC051513]|uniref:hypothetical protein n=1 Tax=Actinoplanes sp. NPDC051513 TaxID=3363908 RepID=UPI0037B80898
MIATPFVGTEEPAGRSLGGQVSVLCLRVEGPRARQARMARPAAERAYGSAKQQLVNDAAEGCRRSLT